MQQMPACLTQEEYHDVLDAIDVFNLWWEDGEPPSRMSPALMMRGWTITTVSDIAPLVGVAVQCHDRKQLMIRDGAPLSVQALTMAHTLGHDILRHRFEIDLIMTGGTRRLIDNRGVHPADDSAAQAAAALLLIPDRFAKSGLSAREIASWCGVPTNVVMRRLTGTVIRENEPPSIIRIDRRGPGRSFVRERLERYTATSD